MLPFQRLSFGLGLKVPNLFLVTSNYSLKEIITLFFKAAETLLGQLYSFLFVFLSKHLGKSAAAGLGVIKIFMNNFMCYLKKDT